MNGIKFTSYTNVRSTAPIVVEAAEPDEYITIDDAARVLKIGRNQAYQAAERGELPGAIRIGRTWRVRRSLLLP